MKLIPVSETRRRLGGVSTMTDWRHRKAGLLPPSIEISKRKFDFEFEIDSILRERAAGADDEAIKGLVQKLTAQRSATEAAA